jgi:hypothetical protein
VVLHVYPFSLYINFSCCMLPHSPAQAGMHKATQERCFFILFSLQWPRHYCHQITRRFMWNVTTRGKMDGFGRWGYYLCRLVRSVECLIGCRHVVLDVIGCAVITTHCHIVDRYQRTITGTCCYGWRVVLKLLVSLVSSGFEKIVIVAFLVAIRAQTVWNSTVHYVIVLCLFADTYNVTLFGRFWGNGFLRRYWRPGHQRWWLIAMYITSHVAYWRNSHYCHQITRRFMWNVTARDKNGWIQSMWLSRLAG